MADSELKVPDEDAELHWKRFLLKVDFYPPMKLTRKGCLSFAERVSEYLDLGHVKPGNTVWDLAGGAQADGVHIQVAKTSITFDARSPQNNLEFYEHHFERVLGVLHQTFSPILAVEKTATVTCLIDLPTGGDAKVFVGSWIMLMHPGKLAPIGRPLHVLGVRLFFPPFDRGEGEDKTSTDWGVNLRVESCMDLADSERLFLEATANWGHPEPWDDGFERKAIQCLPTTEAFMRNEAVKFLRQPPFPDDKSNGE